MKKINVCIIGAGNISNTRHIPAAKKNRKLEVVGVISDNQEKVLYTLNRYPYIKNSFVINSKLDTCEQLSKLDWFTKDVDVVIIGTPPHQHYQMTKACLLLGKHVLVEKPMMMTVEQCDEVIDISKSNNLILNVMHSFQYANNLVRMERLLQNGDLGELQSIVEIQLSNRDRRLPKWYNQLPLGLFFDEAAHFFYTAARFGGDLTVCNAHAQYGSEKENTPKHLEIQLLAGATPVQMYMNFNSPICEWTAILLGSKKMAVYDFFKDILIIADNDKQHLATNVLKTSFQYTFGFWKGFISNGFKMVTNRLLYGHDIAIDNFVNAIISGKSSPLISTEIGRQVVKAMNDVVGMVEVEKNT